MVRNDIVADVTSALRVSWALQRRGLAMEIAGLMTYESHGLIRAKLLDALTQEMPGEQCEPPTLDILRSADREIWKQMAKECAKGIRAATPRDPFPVDQNIEGILDSVPVNMILPLAKARGGQNRQPDDQDGVGKGAGRAGRKRRRGQGSQPAPASSAGQQKTNDKGKGWGWDVPMPRELSGGVPCLPGPNKTPNCVGYNTGRCKAVEPGARCPKGMHVCCKPGCAGLHPFPGAPREGPAGAWRRPERTPGDDQSIALFGAAWAKLRNSSQMISISAEAAAD